MFGIVLAYPWKPKPSGKTGKAPRSRATRAALSVVTSCAFAAAAMTVAAPTVAAATARSPLDVPLFAQDGGEVWKGDHLGYTSSCSGVTIASAGCAVSSMAMVEAYYGNSVAASSSLVGMDPGILNLWLRGHSGFVNGCEISWAGVPAGDAGLSYISASSGNFTAVTSASDVPSTIASRIDSELAANRPVIAYLHNSSITHFVVITGQTSGGDYYINDPGGPGIGATRNTLMFATKKYPFAGIRVFHTSAKVVTVDETSPKFTRGGPTNYWTFSKSYGYGRTMTYTGRSGGVDVNSGTWRPYLPETAVWEVYAWVPNANASANAQYRIQRASGVYSIVTVNQAAYGSVWVSLGRYVFNAGTQGYVYLGDATGDASTTLVGYDAVKFVWRSAASPICTDGMCPN